MTLVFYIFIVLPVDYSCVIDNLSDLKARVAIELRIERLGLGNFGQCIAKSIKFCTFVIMNSVI